MKVINQDITKITAGIIVHQVNTSGIMGAGVAKALSDVYPGLENLYRVNTNLILSAIDEIDLLGRVHWWTNHQGLFVCNLYGQHLRVLNTQSDRKTSYDATVNGWHKVKKACARDLKGWPVYIPYLMGCGLGGGNWEIYSAIVDEIMGPDTVTACKL